MTDNPLTDQELARRNKAVLARSKVAKRTATLLRQCGFKEVSHGFVHGMFHENYVIDPTMHDFESISDVVTWAYNYGRTTKTRQIKEALGL